MMVSRTALLRLQKQQQDLQKQLIPGVLVKRQDTLTFHFLIYKLDGAFEGGYYHGCLILDQDYPLKPPKLKFFTPSGRFETNTNICTSFTNYHPETWNPLWNVKSMIMGTISFMTGNQYGYGAKRDSKEQIQQYAQKSLKFNLQNQKFKKLFYDLMIEKGLISVQKPKKGIKDSQGSQDSELQQKIRKRNQQNIFDSKTFTKGTLVIVSIIAIVKVIRYYLK